MNDLQNQPSELVKFRLSSFVSGSALIRTTAFCALAAVVIAVFRPTVDWDRAMVSLVQINWALLGLAALSVPGLILTRAMRWQILLGDNSRNHYSDFLRATAISFLSIILLPGTGEVSRIAIMKRLSDLPLGFIGGTVLLEKLVDMSLLFGVLALALAVGGPVQGSMPLTTIALSAFILLAGVGLAIVAAPGLTTILRACLSRFHGSPLFAKVMGLVEGVLEGVRVLQAGGPKRAALTLAASLTVFVVGLLPYTLALAAFDLHLPVYAPLLLVTAVSLGTAVPTVPGALGTMQAVIAGALALMSVDIAQGLALGAVIHLIVFIPLILMGLIAIFAESMSLGKLRALPARATETEKGATN